MSKHGIHSFFVHFHSNWNKWNEALQRNKNFWRPTSIAHFNMNKTTCFSIQVKNQYTENINSQFLYDIMHAMQNYVYRENKA